MKPEPTVLVEVAVPIPLRQALTYEVPPIFADQARPGARVRVPVGKRKLTGVMQAHRAPFPISSHAKDRGPHPCGPSARIIAPKRRIFAPKIPREKQRLGKPPGRH